MSIFMAKKGDSAEAVICSSCKGVSTPEEYARNLCVCPSCGRHGPVSARQRIAHLVDPGTFREMERELVSVDPLRFTDERPYRDRLKEASRKTGLREAVLTGYGKIEKQPALFCFLDFQFMGGTMGSVVGEKVTRVFERAMEKELPVVTVSTSGGARMQEGMLSLMQMAKTSQAVARHHERGLPFLSVLANPTTGGIAASFASLGDLLLAEPLALIGFAGPRVVKETIGEELPPGAQRAEFLVEHGMIDLIVSRNDLRKTLSNLLNHLTQPTRGRIRHPSRVAPFRDRGRGEGSSWGEVELARHAGRPTSRDYIERICTDFVELHGDRHFGDDPAIVGGLAEIGLQAVMVIGQERGRGGEEQERCHSGMAFPEGYRKSYRLMQLAAKFKLPVISFVDTPGAHPGYDAETRGIFMALARNLYLMSALPVPVLSVIIGEGGSGGALALAMGDRVLMCEHAIYSVISPEGAAAILYRDKEKARSVAPFLKLTATDLLRLGIVDEVIPEPGEGAHTDPGAMAGRVKGAILFHLKNLLRFPERKLLEARYRKYRQMGVVGSAWKEFLKEETRQFLEVIGSLFGRAVGKHE